MARRNSVLRAFFCVLLLSAQAGAAEPPAPVPATPEILAAARRHLDASQPAQALAWLASFERTLAGDPEYDYLLGVAALESGEPGIALTALERVTLKRPSHAGAWIDLALVHIRLKDYGSAEALLQHVETSFAPPADLAAHIREARRQIGEARSASRWHGEFALHVGRTSNANAGIAVSGISLTPVGSAPIFLDIDPNRRPRADVTTQWRGILQRATQHDDDAQSEWLGIARGKQFQTIKDYETQDAALAYTYDRPLGWNFAGASPLRLALGAGAQHVRLGGDALANIGTANVSLRQPLGACAVIARADIERRHYADAGQADASLLWLGARALCGFPDVAWSIGFRSGDDRPSGIRAGGVTRRHELSADYVRMLGDRLSLEALGYVSRATDAEGYSPLLENNGIRKVTRIGWRATLNWALPGDFGRHWSLQAALEQTRERSNISLFDLEERQLLVGMRYRF